MDSIAPWLVLAAYCGVTWWVVPRQVSSSQFFDGRSRLGAPPGIWLVAMSAAITWIFAKSIANAADLSYAYGLTGGIGYALYYLSFIVAGVAIYVMRTRGGYRSLPNSCWRSTAVFAQSCSCSRSPFACSTRCGPTRR
jgi:solute:Na+ symporter, SSS family